MRREIERERDAQPVRLVSGHSEMSDVLRCRQKPGDPPEGWERVD